MTAETVIAQQLRDEIEARYKTYKLERLLLAASAARIVELDALIAFVETIGTNVKVAPRPIVTPIPSKVKPND